MPAITSAPSACLDSLTVHRLADDAQPLERVRDVDRQRRDDLGELVAQRAALVRRSATDTGTQARSSMPSVRQPARRAGSRRSAPATTASTTSLTVPPSAALIFLRSSRPARTTCEPPVRADADVERRVGRGRSAPPGDLADAVGRLARPVERLRRAGDRAAARRRRPSATRPHRAVKPRRRELGAATARAAAPTARRRADSRPSGVEVEEHVIRSTPETPSTSAWWVLEISAKPSPSRPSTSHSSHSGFVRSRRWEKMRAASAQQLLSSPGCGQRGVAHVVLEVEASGRRPTAAARSPAAARRASGGSAARGAAATRMCASNSSSAGAAPSNSASAADVHVRGRPSWCEEARVDRATAGRGAAGWPAYQ